MRPINTLCGKNVQFLNLKVGSIACLKRDGTRAKTRFHLSPKWTSPFKSAGASVQSTAGSRVVASAVVMVGTLSF